MSPTSDDIPPYREVEVCDCSPGVSILKSFLDEPRQTDDRLDIEKGETVVRGGVTRTTLVSPPSDGIPPYREVELAIVHRASRS